MNEYQLPKCLQVIGLACIPVNDIPDEHPALARRPVAAAVLTMVDQDDGHRWINTICVSDARKSEIPLPHLLDKTLLPGVVQIASMADRMTLAMDAMSRRFFVEPALAELCFGETAIDPAAMGDHGFDERTACRRFSIPMPEIGDADIELAWSRSAPAAAEDHALRVATARLMLWAHVEAFRIARPEPFFEIMLALRDWIDASEYLKAALADIGNSRPIRRADSFAHYYRDYRQRLAAGDETARWVSFEDGLFHA